METALSQARKASRDPRDCRRLIDTLRGMGLGDKEFRQLHHKPDSITGFDNYCRGVGQFMEDGNNHLVHQRLTYILLSCPDGTPPKGESFQTLAEEARKLIR